MVAKVTVLIIIYYSPQIQICHKGSSLLLIQMFINLMTKESKIRKTRCCKNISAELGSWTEPFVLTISLKILNVKPFTHLQNQVIN